MVPGPQAHATTGSAFQLPHPKTDFRVRGSEAGDCETIEAGDWEIFEAGDCETIVKQEKMWAIGTMENYFYV